MALTSLSVRKAKPRDKAYKMFDEGGLFLLVNPSGSKLWRQKYRFLDKEKLLSHGPFPSLTLAQARQKRDDARALLAEGQDPVVQKKLEQIKAASQARTTFKLVAEEFIEDAKERDLADITIKKKNWILFDLAVPLHNRPVSDISAAEVLHLLKNIERSGRRETAKTMRSTLSAVFRLAIVTQRAEVDPTVALKGALIPPKVVGRAAITDEHEFGALLRAFDEFTGWPVIIQAMTFQILTMTRPGEARGAQKAEFDLENNVWTLPAGRTKMRREHKVPLSRQARTIVDANWPQREDQELIFPSLISHRKWLSENAFNSALRRMGYPEHFPPGTLLGPFLGLCDQRVGGNDEALSADDISELRALLGYANQFHHDTNPAWQTAAINDGELSDFARRTLLFASRR